ncbi:MAG: DNA polymerase III subunit alpha [Candidatus Pacebacteria bacterium]|nr:DNA polymerase III subunit alpha [Candidatus Paceibacterota bacterium]
MSKFVHLHTHSHYSLLNALPKIPDLVKQAKKDGMHALALTDNGNLYGAIEFYKECQKKEIKPIIGVDFYTAARTRHDKEGRIDSHRHRLVLLAKNVTGYKNLIKLVTASNLEGFYYRPRIDQELIEKYHEGLICISPSFSGDIAKAVAGQDLGKARELILGYKKIFAGSTNDDSDFYLEITHHPEIQGHQENMQKIISLARETETQLVAAHDVYYIDPEDRKARDTMVSIQNEFGGGAGRGGFGDDEADFSFIDQPTAEKYFSDIPDALDNCQKIVAKCDLKLVLGKWLFPKFELPEGQNADDVLRGIVFEGIIKRGIEHTKEVTDRVEYELGIIKDKGYAPYFLVVADLLRYAHEHGILTNIRGSVAGSMVTYLAYITNINPIEFMLPFERFLNPLRPSAPDIDMDFADDRRDEMIEYARQKYGKDKVAQIGTFGTMMARGSVRDVTRALGYPYALGDRLSKMIPMGSQGFPMTLDKALEITPELQKAYDNEKEAREIIDMAKKIEGCARHISVHAAGVVISPVPLSNLVPLQYDTKGEEKIITQYDMYSVDENNVGLLKFDFLGIKNLSILAEAVSLVKKIEGIDVDLEHIPLDDKKTFEMLARGETEGVFQLNGSGMTKALTDLKPTTIHDINVMVALYRPGPMDTIQEYIARKHGEKRTTYYHPKMKKFLERTFGLLVYQDDLLYTALELAGYNWETVDKFRKAVGKKIPEEMAKQHEIFVKGCIEHSAMTPKAAEAIWKLFEPFQGYGFNKAHAASYGLVSYQTAYMKAHFPAVYMAAVLTADAGDVEKIGTFIAECKRMKIPVLPPDINESFSDFTVVKDASDINDTEKMAQEKTAGEKIRFGLLTIKNFGEGIGKTIIEVRKRGGPFISLEDFLNRIKDRNLNKKSLEALIKAGAMDAFGDRGVMLGNIEDLLEYNKETHRTPANQDSLFASAGLHESLPSLRLKEAPNATPAEKLVWEKELLGLYISGHPLDKYRAVFEKPDTNVTTIAKIKGETLGGIGPGLSDGKIVVVGGIIEEAREILTKKDQSRMMFLKISDFTGTMEVVVFPRTYAEFRNAFVTEKCVALKAKVSERNGEKSLAVESVKVLE